jgi:hypothetical protein
MTITQTVDNAIAEALSTNREFTSNRSNWEYLFQSYLGGQEYKQGAYLTRYQMETAADYNARILVTPLDNHCASVVQVYNSFLFREEPEREFGTLSNSPEVLAFLRDADLDGRSMNSFMKDVSTWTSVYGHCWILLAQP